MHKQTFVEIISGNFNEIVRNFKSGLKNKGYSYDEDLMNDAFISCNSALQNRLLTKKEAIKYYWTAYINKFKTKSVKNKVILYEDMSDLDDIDESKYNDNLDRIYNIILDEVRNEFGIKKAFIWELYVCEGKSIKEIRNMGISVDNFIYLTRQIKRFIVNKLIPKHKELNELIQNRKEI